jgi:hypothetical protein
VSPTTSTPTVIEEPGGRPYESATATYTRILLARHIGYPLWTPEPFNIPPEYEAEGIRIGDIGIVNEDGLFEFSFNFCRPADDPINSAFPLPSSFAPFTYAPTQDVQTNGVFRPKMVIRSGSVQERLVYPSPQAEHERCAFFLDIERPSILVRQYSGLCQFQFDCSTPEGAFLVLPNDACRTNLRSSFRPHILLHARNNCIYLITGYDKCGNWCLASYSNVPVEMGVSLSFTPEVHLAGLFSTQRSHHHADFLASRPNF